ncbi:hypothetical protein DL96DRAFT_1588888 [Flagelloscypha sp. PMI_526]|nr:hypothetical protein DL96DRAFT_1588888 [Flagelloscypha sp. PMI_526]
MSHFLFVSYDILRLLFEFSASCNQGIASNLSLVSREAQLWVDPYLFRFLGQGTKHDSQRILRLLDDMYKADASSRLVRARSYVRGIVFGTWEAGHRYQNLDLFLKSLPNLVNLCVWGNYLPEFFRSDIALKDVIPPRLRRVHTCSATLASLPDRKLDYPLWRQITHLQLHLDHEICDDYSPFSEPLLNTMHNLTHLAISSGDSSSAMEPESDIALTVSRAKASFPATLQLCLLSLPPKLISQQTFPRIDSLRLGEVPEVVLWSMPYYKAEFILDIDSRGPEVFSVWSGAPDGMLTFWEAGSEIQRQRKNIK